MNGKINLIARKAALQVMGEYMDAFLDEYVKLVAPKLNYEINLHQIEQARQQMRSIEMTRPVHPHMAL
jgi:hypothetical protein